MLVVILEIIIPLVKFTISTDSKKKKVQKYFKAKFVVDKVQGKSLTQLKLNFYI